MNIKSSIKIVATLMCILMIYSNFFISSSNKENIIYAHNKEKYELSSMQEAFFEIAKLKENNNNLSKNDINQITDKFTLKSTKKRELDVINTYIQKSDKKEIKEKLDVFRSLDEDMKIEGVIYSLYNSKNDINVIRMQYHDFEKDGKYIRLEVTTENINNIDTILSKVNHNTIKSELYSDYKYAYNIAKSNDKFEQDKLVNIEKIKSNKFNKQFQITKGENECLLFNVDNSTNKLKSAYYDFGNKVGKYQDCLSIISNNSLDEKGKKYYNLSPDCDFANTLMLFKENVYDLKELFLQYNK